jgi:hypothetical protein
MSDTPAIKPGRLAIENIREKVRALIRPTALDFFKAAAEARRGIQVEETRLHQCLLALRDRGRAAATRLSVLARDPEAAAPERYDRCIKHKAR